MGQTQIEARIQTYDCFFTESREFVRDLDDVDETTALQLILLSTYSGLCKLPLLPLFVFDGRERPKVKRGSKMGKAGSHNLTDGMKKLLDAFGVEWRMVSIT